MDEPSSVPPDEESGTQHKKKPPTSKKKFPKDIVSDGIFSIKVNEDMALRNALRRGLVEAQGKNTDKMPMLVSWPHWLEDGIVCMFAKDFHHILHQAVRETAQRLGDLFEIEDMDVETKIPLERDDAESAVPLEEEAAEEEIESDKAAEEEIESDKAADGRYSEEEVTEADEVKLEAFKFDTLEAEEVARKATEDPQSEIDDTPDNTGTG